jgi:hypothetical protein
MHPSFFYKDDQYLLNRCTKYLARKKIDGTGTEAGDVYIAEAWRFPIIDTYAGGADSVTDSALFGDYNEVTFIYAAEPPASPRQVGVVGTFGGLHAATPLRPVLHLGAPTRYWSVTFAVPKGQRHIYKFLVDGRYRDDPVNPQRQTLDNGRIWPRFFTETFTQPLALERWELDVLSRLVATIAPFQSDEARNFLRRFYYHLDLATKLEQFSTAYRLDDSVGETNFINNLLGREERHRLSDYKVCLGLIDDILRERNPGTEPTQMSSEIYDALYDQMAEDDVPGWDERQYPHPQNFLYLLRRHVVLGAFSHPKYGGNTNGAGWAYLAESYREPSPSPGVAGKTLFDWRRAIEQPLGTNADYHG